MAAAVTDQLLGALRSVRRVLREAPHDQRGERGRHSGAVLGHGVGRSRHLGGKHALGRHSAERRPPRQDRKSTRLNSSHGYISYAVFCLKKKKKKNTIFNFDEKKKKKK